MNFPGDRDSRIWANICCQHCCLVILTRCMTNLAPLLQVGRSDVMSSWSGKRHLATNPNVQGTDTASISRDHVVCLDLDGLVTVTGGKWTTYRRSVFPRRCRRIGQC